MSVSPLPVEPVWTFADRLRKARLLTGMDQRGFAAALGVTSSAVAAWETERAHPRDIVGLAKTIEARFGVSAAWMLDVTGKPVGYPVRAGSQQVNGSVRAVAAAA